MAWGYKRTVTIDHTKCGTASSTDFPVLISGTYTYLKTVANSGKVQSASGYDIAFYSDSDLTTMLKFERVSWSASTGVVQFFVKIPTLSHTDDTVIYLAYGNSSITTDQQDAANTWNSNFKGVWHLEVDPSGSAPQELDSTANNNDGTSAGTMTSGDLVAGKISNALDFDGSNDVISCADAASLDVTGNYSLAAWIRPTNVAGNSNQCFIGKNLASSYFLEIRQVGGSDYRIAMIQAGGLANENSPSTITNNNWYRIWYTYSGTTPQIYNNGNAALMTGSVNGPSGNGDAMYIGGDVSGSYNFFGYIDEVYKIDAVASSSWITADYNNQNDPATFYALGDETTTNNPPATPTNSTPANAATGQSRNPTLTGSAFSDADAGATHAASQWQIATDSGFSNVVWDSGATATNLTSVAVTSSNGTFAGALAGLTKLALNTTYYWHVKYSDGTDYSSYSSATTFTTIASEGGFLSPKSKFW